MPFHNTGSEVGSVIGLLVLAVVVVAAVRTLLRSNVKTLVLSSFRVNRNPADGVFVEIRGRQSGLIAFILTAVGLDVTTTLQVRAGEFSLTETSLSGKFKRMIPLPCMASTHCGFSKPIHLLLLGLVFIVAGVMSGLYAGREASGVLLTVLCAIGILMFIAYSLSKKITLFFESGGGLMLGISFKRSVIENVAVDIHKAEEAIAIVNGLVVLSHTPAVPGRSQG